MDGKPRGVVSHRRIIHLLKLVIGHDRSLIQEQKGLKTCRKNSLSSGQLRRSRNLSSTLLLLIIQLQLINSCTKYESCGEYCTSMDGHCDKLG